ncbi:MULTISPECIES: pseudaminic acid synthase [Aliiglaciecola]|uniref:pseudaminic acid synthase n=1 Tax=Aliiglaciecola TaxID=1406885 RepID=UPI001C095EEA|nr:MULTISPECIES: pseudaminic acid synthase [Aliiglaciecola]MBU2877989.1 pseudaminic acid synthase [Aliiglaciecola lipolytica]MDO6709354.1 pseudaminic acid synthase [Aliiglaciecola sp. 2_MG-2023]MDO6750502.1 pseudaminic acid synthase [Aliiglaciecola sp. 1_MG-2023]
MHDIAIGERLIGPSHPPFIIAELSGNHSQDFELAVAMVEAAAKAGAHAIKLQTYTADSMTLNVDSVDFVIQEKDSLWHGEALHSLYAKASTPYEWHSRLFARAKALGMEAFSSPFDEAAVDFLETLDVPCYKIASFELTDIPLIRKAAATGKPLIMSTGMATLAEIEQAVDCAKKAGCEDIILLKCTSTYPAQPSNTNLVTIPHLRGSFNQQVGLSDHTAGIGVSVAAVALGATVIEKHFVLDRNAGGVDAAFSLEPAELKSLVEESARAFDAMGKVTYGGSAAEEKSKHYRRSIFVSVDVKKGQTLSRENLRIVRPASGLAPKHWDSVLGKKAKTNLPAGTALDWDLFE